MLKTFFLVLILLTMGCEKKVIPLPDHLGGQIYNGLMRIDVRCVKCHGDLGEGTDRAPALVHDGKTIPRALFIKTVLEGRNRMPMFSTVLNEEQVGQIADWLEKIQ